MFLVGAGGATMAIPFLPSLLPELAHAAPPKNTRYIQICSNFHPDPPYFLPNPSSHVPVIPWEPLGDGITKRQGLAELIAAQGHIAPGLKGADWEALAPYLNLVFGSNLNGSNDKHHSTAGTTASSPHDVDNNDLPSNHNPFFKYSLDHLIEKKLAAPSHLFGALRTHLVYRHAQFDDGGQPLPQSNGVPNGYLHSEYTKYCFGGPDPNAPDYALTLPEMYDVAELELKLAGIASGDEVDPRRAARGKLIDAVLEDFHRLQQHPRLSQVDRGRLGDAVDLWNDARNKLAAAGSCAFTPGADGVPDGTGGTRASWRVYHHYLMDLLGYSLACGLTPVVTYVLNHSDDEFPNDYDELIHLHGAQHGNADDEAYLLKMTEWRIARVAYFANQLRQLQDEAGESLLDSSLLYWNQEYAAGGHSHAGHVSMLIGKAGGRLQTGSFLDVAGEPTATTPYYKTYQDGVPLNRVLITILRACGLSTEEIEVGGQPGFGEYGDFETSSNDHREGASFGWSNEGRQKYYSTEEKRKALPILVDV
jgi:hypothetical protein